MAYVDADAIITRVREVLEDGTGSLRTITTGTYYGGLFPGVDGGEESMRAAVKPRIEPSVRVVGRNENTPGVMGSYNLIDVEVTVRVVRFVNANHKLKDSLADDVKAAAARDADVIRQALTYPNNLTATSGGTATGLCTGLLSYEGSDEPSVEWDDADNSEGGRIETVHRFTGIVQVTQAAS